MLPYPPFSDSGTATLLRGFGYQIATLKKPTIKVVQEIAEGVGLRVMREQDYQEMLSQFKDVTAITTDHIIADQEIIEDSIELVTKLKFILVSQLSDADKLSTISALIINETVS